MTLVGDGDPSERPTQRLPAWTRRRMARGSIPPERKGNATDVLMLAAGLAFLGAVITAGIWLMTCS